MKDRLQQLLTGLNLTATRLAEELKIQRSGISHILSGRNQPSYEFLNRIMTRYPAINARWLILGEGSMFNEVEIPFPGLNRAEFSKEERKKSIEGNSPEVTYVNNTIKITGIVVLKSDGTFDHYNPAVGD